MTGGTAGREGSGAGRGGGRGRLRCGVLRRIRPDSDKSAAAMRAAPIGLLPTPDDVLHHAAVQGAVTQDTPAGIVSAPAVHYFHRDLGPLAAIGAWKDGYVPGGWARPWRGKVGSKGRMSAAAALTALAGRPHGTGHHRMRKFGPRVRRSVPRTR
ncbi:ADP-ribosylglycohydrolase family protein [Nocardia grenadensis]|uniref:ADP-ribosylglycohydrolase family protein n=1 Tax=Nocardia grenadensis TaxID=931537 RepID=UPI003D722661